MDALRRSDTTQKMHEASTNVFAIPCAWCCSAVTMCWLVIISFNAAHNVSMDCEKLKDWLQQFSMVQILLPPILQTLIVGAATCGEKRCFKFLNWLHSVTCLVTVGYLVWGWLLYAKFNVAAEFPDACSIAEDAHPLNTFKNILLGFTIFGAVMVCCGCSLGCLAVGLSMQEPQPPPAWAEAAIAAAIASNNQDLGVSLQEPSGQTVASSMAV